MRLSPPLARRALTNGLIAGAAIAFFVLIGVPGGASDADSLPAWFAWGLFILIAFAFGYRAARGRTVAERRSQTLGRSVADGLIVGLVAALLIIALMCVINAAQLWEINLSPEATTLPNGFRSNITRVQDVLANVTPRTTAVMAGLPLDTIKTQDVHSRANPVGRFFLMAGLLLPVAGLAGGSASQFMRLLAARRGRASKTGVDTAKPERVWLRWLPIGLPLILFAFIVFNAVVPVAQGPLADVYKSLIGSSGQLVGLLTSFFLIASGLLAIRVAGDEHDAAGFVRRVGVLVTITIVLFAIGFAAPSRNASDLLFSPRPASLTQVTGPDGQPLVITKTVQPVDANTLYDYRRLAIVALGLIFLIGNVVSARGETPFRKLVATNVLLGTLVVAPLFLDKYQQSVLLLVGINVLLGLGLNIVVGYAGLLDLGYVAFFAIGAYAYAFLSSDQDIRAAGQQVIGLKYAGNDQVVQIIAQALFVSLIVAPIVIGIGLRLWRSRSPVVAAKEPGKVARPAWLSYALVFASVAASLIVVALLRGTSFYDSFADFPAFVLGVILGMAVAALSGVLLGIPVLRLRGDYLAIVTLGFGEIIRLILNNLRDVTGGPQGMLRIPHANIGSVEVGSNEGLLYLVLGGCILVAFVSLRLKSSRLGRAWGALRSDEDIAQAMGINVVNTKVLAFAIGAAFAGIGGVLYAARQASIFPDNFTLAVSINVLSLIIIGGMGSVPGVIVGALVLIGVPESLRVFEVYRVMAFGALLVTMMLLRPGGLLPEPPQPLEHRAKLLAAADKEVRP
jgi:ABC-type branched-subunit amino acid transport system permease subunit